MKSVVIMMCIGLSFTFLNSWDSALEGDEIFSALASIGQIPFGTQVSKDHTLESHDIWENNNTRGVYQSTMADNGNMLVQNFIVHYIIKYLGPHQPYYLRLLSIGGYISIIFLSYMVGRTISNEGTGLIASFLCCFNTTLIIMGVELRSYSFATSISLISTLLFLRIVNNPDLDNPSRNSIQTNCKRRYCLLGIFYTCSVILMTFSHFLSLVIVLVHVIFSVIYLRNKEAWKTLVFSGMIVIAIFSYWFVYLGGNTAISRYGVMEKIVNVEQSVSDIARNESNMNRLAIITASVPYKVNYTVGIDIFNKVRYNFTIVFLISAIIVYILIVYKIQIHLEPNVLLIMMCALSCLAIGIARVLFFSKTLFGFQNIYMRFSIPYAMIAISFIIDKTIEKLNHSQPLLDARLFLLIYCVPLMIYFYPMTFHKFTDPKPTNSYYIAKELQQNSDQFNKLLISVPTILDAQMLTLYSGQKSNFNFLISDYATTMMQSDQISQVIGIRHPICDYYQINKYYKSLGILFGRTRLKSVNNDLVQIVYEQIK